MIFYQKDKDAVLQELQSSEEGLSTSEAEYRLEQNGKNKLDDPPKKSLARRFLEQLIDPMIIVLLVAAVISAVVDIINKEFPASVFIILFVVVLNSVLGVLQESKAEKAIEALKQMTSSTSKVLRDGKMTVVKSEDLVRGDVILLEAGDAVPADCRLLEAVSLKCEEAALTGESVPVDKHVAIPVKALEGDVPLGDRTNMVYSGSTVAYGRGKAVVCEVGMKTEMGKIANAITEVSEEKTPLQQKLAQLSKILTWGVMAICVIIFVVGLIKAGSLNFTNVILPTFMVAVSLAVAAVPEGLVAVVTIVLSMGVTKMAKREAVIRKLTAVETLGCTQVICSDKTGTLTQNKMTVVEDFTTNKELLAMAMAMCSDAEVGENGEAVGEPTECALVNYATSMGLNKTTIKLEQPRVAEVPFDSMRKMMTTVHDADGKFIQYTKGAPDEILKRCSYILTKDGLMEMDNRVRNAVLSKNKAFADKALRVLGAAYRMHRSAPSEDMCTSEELERDMIFIGLCGMIDPVRPEVKDAIVSCKGAGIRPIMITGDHKDTAVAIAKELGIITDESEAITGAELDTYSDAEFAKAVDKISVYARVQPEHKVRIVTALKKKGNVTAMTGDGVNDAPSIKAADIGVGMGITGTDVTKNVADMVLGDDNFATIIYAVEEGRKIYSNIRKTIQFLLSSNISEVMTIFIATMLGFTILKAPHLLWINLITDSLPALALGMEAGEKDVMKQKPRSTKDGIFAGGVGFDLLYQGLIITILTISAYFVGAGIEFGAGFDITQTSSHGITMAFLTMSMAEIFHSFNMRSQRKSIFSLEKFNFYLLGAMVLAIILTTSVIEIPFLARLFDFTELGVTEYMIGMMLAILIIPIVELVKYIQRLISNKKSPQSDFVQEEPASEEEESEEENEFSDMNDEELNNSLTFETKKQPEKNVSVRDEQPEQDDYEPVFEVTSEGKKIDFSTMEEKKKDDTENE